MWHMHAPPFNKWQKKKKKKTLHVLTDGENAMRGCGLTSLVCALMTEIHDMRGEKCDNKEYDLNYEHALHRVGFGILESE